MTDLHGDLGGTFPFEARFLQVAEDVRLHYVEEGTGDPVLMLHGNPTWSYLYRKIIPPVAAAGFRAIAPDHMGFGRSDRPSGHRRYTLRSHVDNLLTFVRELDLRDITLVMQDWGGPIGFGMAVEEPARIARLVIMNTGVGVFPGEVQLPFHGPFLQRGLGEMLCLGANLFVEGMPGGMRRESATEEVMAAYRAPFPDYYSRVPILALVRDVPIGHEHPSAPYMAEIGSRMGSLDVPALLVWGMRDHMFPAPILEFWKATYPGARVVELPEGRHYLQEDEPEAISEAIASFLGET